MDRGQIRSTILAALEHEAPAHNTDIVDVELAGPTNQPVLTIRIDRAGYSQPPITLDEVSQHSSWISAIIEELDLISSSYVLEVSSPGLDRPLRRPSDFERFAHETVVLVTHATSGRRRYTGELLGMNGDKVQLSCDDGEFSFSLDEIKTCNIKPTFDFSEPAEKSQ